VTKLKPGDRVAVYDGCRFVGVVQDIDENSDDQSVYVVSSSSMCDGWYHPKQCRKLVKRGRRRVWMLEKHLKSETFQVRGLGEPAFKEPEPLATGQWVEFIEVRKKK
jgi:hypothetical protein